MLVAMLDWTILGSLLTFVSPSTILRTVYQQRDVHGLTARALARTYGFESRREYRAEESIDLLERHGRVLDDIVQEAGKDGRLVHPRARENERDHTARHIYSQ